MKTFRTITCSIWSEDAFACKCADITDSTNEDEARRRAEEMAREAFSDQDGDFSSFHRIWFTDVTIPAPDIVHSTITAELPPLPDPEALEATVS